MRDKRGKNHTVRRLGALGAVAAAFLAAAPIASASCFGSSRTASQLTEAQFEQTILCLVNERRKDKGRRPLRPNPKLQRVADRHSADMVNRGYFGHTSPTGSEFADRILSTGYTRRARRYVLGENLVWGRGATSTPAYLVTAWMNSPPHRANLMRKRFREIGVGAVRGTPVNARDSAGITLSNEYGYRKRGQRKRR